MEEDGTCVNLHKKIAFFVININLGENYFNGIRVKVISKIQLLQFPLSSPVYDLINQFSIAIVVIITSS